MCRKFSWIVFCIVSRLCWTWIFLMCRLDEHQSMWLNYEYMGSWAHESFFRASRRLAVWRGEHIICSLLQTGHSWGRRLSSASSFSSLCLKSSRTLQSLVLYPCPAGDKPSISFLIHAGQLDSEMTTRDYFYWFYFLRTAASKLSSDAVSWVSCADERLTHLLRLSCMPH